MLCSIADNATNVARTPDDTANKLRDAAEQSIVDFLISMESQGGTSVRPVLSHFDQQIREIIRGILNTSGYGNGVLCKIIEECYIHATDFHGTLHPDDYFDESDEDSLGWPYDSDYEAEEYYEHENRLVIDESYAEAIEEQKEQRMQEIEHKQEEREREKQTWIAFWVLLLHRCPNGPTLFYPPGSNEVELQTIESSDIPPYLFRTFDGESSGISNENIVASSMGSSSEFLEQSRQDLLSLPKSEATAMLHSHLTKICAGPGAKSDNLMSWTSSLLNAVQYAIWRRHTFKSQTADIKICVIDTRRFPQGQFAPDIWLLQAYYDTVVDMGSRIKNDFRFRLETERYYNGEYLSQGSLNHTGRSCIVSLKTLEESGLCHLYTEFADKKGEARWTENVRDIRNNWSIEQ